MVTQPQYILAKYIPEVLRNEPRNVGVILWTPWGVSARFQGEQRGVLDGRKTPPWIESYEAYREWVHSWRRILTRKTVKNAEGQMVSSDLPEFLEALRATGKANYVLADSGSVIEEIAKEDSEALLTFLFESLVDESTEKEEAKAAFDFEAECNRIIRGTRAFRSNHFRRKQPVMVPIGEGVVESFEFDYFVGNGTAQAVYQRVPMVQRGFDRLLHATAFQFESVIKAGLVNKEQSAALVMPTPEQKGDEEFRRAVAVLKTQTRVLDLSSEQDEFVKELNSVPEE